MNRIYLLTFIAVLIIWETDQVLGQDASTQRKGAIVTSSSGLTPVPPELRNTMPKRVYDDITSSEDVPDYVVYQLMFKQIGLMSQTDGKLGVTCQGKPLSPIFKEKANLSKNQYKDLLKIIDETNVELDKINQKTMAIVREFRARTPNGRLAPGEPLPSPPPEYEALNKQKIELLEGAMKKIRESFGEKDYARFSLFVDENFRFKIKKMTVKIPVSN